MESFTQPQDPTVLTHDGDDSAAPFIPYAAYRSTIRKQLRRNCEPITNEAKDQCKYQYTLACRKLISEKVPEELDKTIAVEALKKTNKKKRKAEVVESCLSDKVKVLIKNKLTAKSRSPIGLFEQAYGSIIALPGYEHLSSQDVRNRLGKGFAVGEYNTVLMKNFEALWMKEASLRRQEFASAGSADLQAAVEGDRSPSTAACAADDGAGEAHDDEDEGDLEDEALLSAVDERNIHQEAKDRNKRHCFMFPVSLTSILHPTLKAYTQKIADLLKPKQEVLTDAVDELFCLLLETTILSTSNAHTTTLPEFDIMRLLPTGFKPRSDAATKVNVGPVPPGFNARLDPHTNSNHDNWTNDLQDLLGYEHLGYLYARFIGTDGPPVSSSTEHPLWCHLADVVEEYRESLYGPPAPRLARKLHPMQ
ncbi:hypothetical protein BGW39_003425, partial [Mortierella sp. 14UC]